MMLVYITELGQSLSDFGKAAKLLGACEGDAIGKLFSELGAKSETLSVRLQKEVSIECLSFYIRWFMLHVHVRRVNVSV